jgi:hypothetical protein
MNEFDICTEREEHNSDWEESKSVQIESDILEDSDLDLEDLLTDEWISIDSQDIDEATSPKKLVDRSSTSKHKVFQKGETSYEIMKSSCKKLKKNRKASEMKSKNLRYSFKRDL